MACDTDLRLRGPGTDHVPVLTTLDFEVAMGVEELCRNFRATDWDKFREVLANWLCDILGPCALLTDWQFQRAVDGLMQVLQAMIETVVPVPWPSPHSRRWWSRDLSQLKKEMNWLGSQSYRYRALADHPSHGAHKQAWGRYSEAIKQAKEQHWHNFLEGITGKELWMAHKYVSCLIGDGGKAQIPMLKVNNGNGTSRDISTNAEKGGVFGYLFFPSRLTSDLMPSNLYYPDWVRYSFHLTVEQLRHCVARL